MKMLSRTQNDLQMTEYNVGLTDSFLVFSELHRNLKFFIFEFASDLFIYILTMLGLKMLNHFCIAVM
jgi:hypothetical protein